MKMYEKKLKRFGIYKKTANVLFILTLVVCGLFMLVSLLGGLYIAKNNVDIAGIIGSVMEHENIPVRFTQDMVIPHGVIFLFIAFAVFSFALIAYLFKSAARLFGFVVEDKTPFTQKGVKVLKSMGIAFFVYTGLKLILNLIMPLSFGSSMSFGLGSIEFKYILFGMLMLSLGEIFEFGMNLQKDSESIV